jgi:Ca2+:H+ antiporter
VPEPPNPRPAAAAGPRWAGWLRRERFFPVSVASGLAFLWFRAVLFADLTQPLWLLLIFSWLFVAILGSALAVVRHADELAHRLGEPYGTLILTLAVTAIEAVAISALMLHGGSPAVVRDTLFAVIMLLMNGVIGVSLLLGGWRHGEQSFNSQGANAYLGVIIPLVMLSLILPDFTQTTPGPTLSIAQERVLIAMSLGLYGAFLAIQTGRHRGFFTVDGPEPPPVAPAAGAAAPTWAHALLLAAYMIPVVYLAEQLATPLEYMIHSWRAPAAIGGVLIAILVATPEAVSAVRAALANQLQRSVNILMGSVLSTISLTIPTMLVISHLTGRRLVLGIEHANFALLLLTLLLSVVTFGSGRTNVLQGLVHALLFVAYCLLIFQG